MIHIVTALPCEARPLIDRYRLQGRQREHGFRIYENHALRLIIAGVGKCAAAAACAYLQGRDAGAKHAWLNLGIAGHRHLAVGTAVLAHKVGDAASGQAWYPPLPFQVPCTTVDLVSVDQPEGDYGDGTAYDMEAAGFYATAARFNTHELVQVLKVISDNAAHPADQVTATHAEQLITARLDTIDAMIRQLGQLEQRLGRQHPESGQLQPYLQRWHFSVSQQHQLQRLLQRWQALAERLPEVDEFAGARSGKQVIAALQARLATLPVRWP